MVDANALAALNARFESRLAALWSAAAVTVAQQQQGALTGSAPPRLASVIEPPPGDSRFSASEWTELPYFSLIKQAYLLAAEYATALAALTPLPEDGRR